jgi:hypothetical protein
MISSLVAHGDDQEGTALLRDARQQISAYHAGQPESHRVLRVVYFTPSDRDPLGNYEERLDRILNDVSDFYRDGFRRLGQDCGALPLEKKDGKLVIHLVKGKLPASAYSYQSGTITKEEVRAALKGTVDLDHEHVLILYALCRKEPDGRYVFDAPYYGDGSSTNSHGLCHAADCELLDPQLLTEKAKKIVYTEHYYPRVEQTLATFNTWYLGGIAHELGHGLGLPHDNGSNDERSFGSSLMGGGNLHYRENLWGGNSPAFLSRTTALQLASNPLITGSDRGRDDAANGFFEELAFTDQAGVLSIAGKATGSVPPYAVAAYAWPASARSDHGAITYPVVLKQGAFTLDLSGLRKEPYKLKLSSFHVNGATSTEYFQLLPDGKGGFDTKGLTAEWLVDRVETAISTHNPRALEFASDQVIASAPTPESAGKLRVLRSLMEPAALADLAAVAGKQVYLSDVAWTAAEVGWGKPARNSFWSDERFQMGTFLTLDQKFYDKGLYAHSPSRYGFAVDQKWKFFTATVGLRDGANPAGSAVFVVRGDGKELYRSELLHVGTHEAVAVDISEVKDLQLLTEGGNGNSNSSWAVWVNPLVRR